MDWSNADFSHGLPDTLNGVQVMMNGQPAAIYYISAGQINVQAPSSTASGGTVTVQVIRNGTPGNSVTLSGSAVAPGLFTYSADLKTYYPAATFLDGSIIGDPAVFGNAVHKAKVGDQIVLYATGLAVSPAGVLIPAPLGTSGVTVKIGSTVVTPSFAGLVAPGEFQINLAVPQGVAVGNQPLFVVVNGQSSQTGVVLPIGN